MPQHRARKTYSRWRWLPAVAALVLVGAFAVVLTTAYAPRPPVNGACPALRIVTAASFAPILRTVATCGPLEITVADGRGAAARAAAVDADLWLPDDAAWRGAPGRLALA